MDIILPETSGWGNSYHRRKGWKSPPYDEINITWIIFVQEDHSTAPGTMVGPVAPNPLQGVPVRPGQIPKNNNKHVEK